MSELLIFLLMIVIFAGSCFFLKLPVGIALLLSSVGGALAGGFGVPVKFMVEGTMSFLDTILVIACAMIFMKCIQYSGALDMLNRFFLRRFHNHKVILLLLLMLIIMFPGMITGSSTAAVISAGAIVCPILIAMGIPAEKAAAIIALGGMYGATAPPVNIAVMTIGGGVDIPYVGFGIPLLLLSVPLAIFSVLVLGLKDCKNMDYEQVTIQLQIRDDEKMSFVMLLPVFVLLALILLPSMLPNIVPSLSMTIVFMISALLCILTGKKFSVWAAIKEGVNSSLPVMGILMGVGMFIEIMTMTGVKGWLVVNCLALPDALIFVAIAVTIPLFGAISSLGAASVFGVPFLLALMSRDTIVVAAALASIASVGELMPPTALAGIFASKVAGLEQYTGVLKKCLPSALLIIAWSLLFIIFANPIASLLP